MSWIRQFQMCETKVNGDSAKLLFGQAVWIGAGQGFYQGALAVIHVSRGGKYEMSDDRHQTNLPRAVSWRQSRLVTGAGLGTATGTHFAGQRSIQRLVAERRYAGQVSLCRGPHRRSRAPNAPAGGLRVPAASLRRASDRARQIQS